ncbi:hypothetical protein Tco_0428914 [Tanacetum coccineum]
MSADSAVTYTSVHSEARSWSIPSEDPYEEAARQLLEQAPRSPEYIPDLIELEDHVPVYIPEPKHLEDLVPAEDEAPIEAYITEVASAPPPSFLPSLIRPPRTRAAMAQMRAASPSTYHPLLPLGTPPLLPIPPPAPSTSHRADIPEADTPPRKRLLLTAPKPGCEVGESSAAAAARQPGPTMARMVNCSSVDTVETRVRDNERRMMAALEVVNLRVSYQVDARSRESLEFYSRHHDAQKDRANVRAEIEVLRRERIAYEQESIQTRQDLARSEAYNRALEAQITVLETQARRHEWQRQDADDRATRHIMRIQALEAGARDDTIEDTGFAAAMAEAEASRVKNGYNSNDSLDGSVFSISNCPAASQVKFATCTLQDDALTWWNSHVKTTTPKATLKKMMTDKYCPRGEIKKIETEMWNLKVKGIDVVAYCYIKGNDAVEECAKPGAKTAAQLNNLVTAITKTRKEDLKGITTRSGVAYQGPAIPSTSSSPPKVMNHDTEVTKDTMLPTNNGSTEDIQPPVSSSPISQLPSQLLIPLVLQCLTNEHQFHFLQKNVKGGREKANDQIKKFYEIL